MTRLLETLNPIEALVHETLNGEYELTFTTTARDVNKFDLLSAHTPNGRQLFRVAGVTNHADKSEIFARHVFFDLSGNFSLGFESKDVTCQTMINKFVSSLTEPLAPFALSTDITARNSYNPEEANALEILSHGKRSIVGVNDAELLRDNYAVKLQKRLGSDTNVLIHPRNNILDLKREYSSDDICTKIFLRGGTEEAPLEATITSPLIDKYPVVYARRYQNETESITTVEQLIAWGKLHFDTDRIDVPKLSFDFDVFGDLGLQLGDSALVRVPELDVDVRSRVTGYDYDPMTRKYVKLYFGDKSTGLAGFIGDTTTGIVDEAVKNVDEKLQAEIDNANAAIQKEYEARVESVNDAIAKAEADAEVMKEALQTEISQAVTDWNTEFEEAKTQIDNSIENVSKELGEYIESTDEIIAEHDDLLADASAAIGNMNTEIGNAKNDISDLFESTEANQGAIVTVSNNLGTLSTKVSNVETTANTANATASEVKQTASGLTSSVSSLQGTVNTATGDITKLKSDVTTVTQTATGLSSKVTSLESDNVTNKQNIASVTQTADGLKNEVSSVTTTANTALAKATTVEQTASGLSSKVTSLETSDSTQNSNISTLQQTASGLTSTVSSHTSSIDGLNSTVSTHTSEIQQTADKISMIVSDGSTASAVQLTPNALTAIAKDINLKGNVQFDSLVEGDGTNTQILGGKIKTNSISANKLIVGNSQSLVRLTKGEGNPNTDIVSYHHYWGLTFKDEGLPVCSLTPHFKTGEAISTEQLGWANKEIKLRITHNIFYGPYVPFYFDIYCFDDNGAVTLSAQTEPINPSHNVNSIQNHVIDLGVIDQNKHRYVYIRLLRPTTESFSEYGVNTLTITEMNAGELIVDGAIKANHIVSGSAELGTVTSKILSTDALNAAWANIGNAFINKLTSDDALFQRLTAKSAWITSANIVSLEASRIKGGTLQSTNGLLSWNLENSYLRFSGASNAMEYVLGGNSVGIRFGDLYSKVLSKTVPTVSLYANTGADTANTRIDLISQEQQINIRGDRISFYDHDSSAQGWHLNTVGGTNRWDQSLTPFGNGYNELGRSDRYFYAVRATNMIDTLSLFSMPTTFSEQRSFTDISALDVIGKCQVREFLEGDGFTNTIDLERDTPENAKIGVDFTYLRRLKTSDASLLFTEQGEMTLNTEIAILWKAVQELSEQNVTLRDEIALERSERETLRAENDSLRDDVATLRAELALERSERDSLRDDVATLRTQLNALADLIAGKATVTVRS